jgi:hypothetical protein
MYGSDWATELSLLELEVEAPLLLWAMRVASCFSYSRDITARSSICSCSEQLVMCNVRFSFSFSGFNSCLNKDGGTNPREWHAVDEVPFASLQLHLVSMGYIKGILEAIARHTW